MKTKRDFKKIFVKQYGDVTCGLACLAMIIRYYGGDAKQDDLRNISGTSIQGTTLLGLYQAAEKLHLKAAGYEANLDNLKELTAPAILHVVKNKNQNHYIVCFGYKNEKFIIADPSWGILYMDKDELDAIWHSKALLLLETTEKFVKKETDRRSQYYWLHLVLKEDYPLLVVAFILGIFIAALGLVTAIFSQQLIDKLLPAKDFIRLMLGTALFLILQLFKSMFEYLRNIFMARQSRDFNNRMVDKFFEKILNLTKTFFNSTKTGEIIARMNDSRRIQGTIAFIVSGALIDGLILLFSVSFMFFYSWQIALLASACIPLYALLIVLYNRKIIDKQREVMVSYAGTESMFIDYIQGVDEIKNANKQSFFRRGINFFYGLFQDCSYNLGLLGAKYNLYAQIISITIMTSIILLGAFYVLDDKIMLGELMATISIAGMIIMSSANLSVINIRLQEAGVAFNRYFEFIKAETEPMIPEETESEKITSLSNGLHLEIKNLSFRFTGRKKLFENVSLEAQRGEITILLGEVGSGKSTLIQLLQRHYKPETGKILFNETSIYDLSFHEWRNLIGVVNQKVKLFNGRIGENICLDDFEQERKKVTGFCKDYGFDRFFETFPQGLDTLIGEDGINISGGQQQLISLARALYRKPALLLLDEPSSSMDNKTEIFVMDMLKQRRNQFTTLLVTHRAHLCRYAHKVYTFEGETVRCIEKAIEY